MRFLSNMFSKARRFRKPRTAPKRRAQTRTRPLRFEQVENRTLLSVTLTWTGGPGNDFNTPANYFPAQAPAGNNILFDNSNIQNDAATNVGGGINKLTISKTLFLAQDVNLGVSTTTPLTITNDTLISGGTVTLSGGLGSRVNSNGDGLDPAAGVVYSAQIAAASTLPDAAVNLSTVEWCLANGLEIGGAATAGPSRLYLGSGSVVVSAPGRIYVLSDGSLEGGNGNNVGAPVERDGGRNDRAGQYAQPGRLGNPRHREHERE